MLDHIGIDFQKRMGVMRFYLFVWGAFAAFSCAPSPSSAPWTTSEQIFNRAGGLA